MTINIGINGMGRIGRMVIRAIIESQNKDIKIKISIEAASTDCWKKYIGRDGLSFGIDTFGKSAPYKEIYKHFGLTAANITNKTKKLFGKKI